MDYILFGIQGAGKGTQGKILAGRISAAYFETGGELRRLSQETSELGKKIKSIIETGKLVPNEVVMEIVENFVTHVVKSGQPVIFDGIPRNKEQSDTFEALLRQHGRNYMGVYFQLPREDAQNRLINRRICMDCKKVYPVNYTGKACSDCGGQLYIRADDNPSAIKTRIDIFYQETLPVIKEWRSHGKIITIDGGGTIEEVTAAMFSKL